MQTGHLGPVRIVIPPAFRIRKLLISCTCLQAQINPRLPAVHSSSYSSPNGYYNASSSASDYPSVDPRPSQRPHLSPPPPPGSSRSVIPHSSSYPQDKANSIYGWREQASSSRADSTRPPLPPKIPSKPTQITHVPEPSIPNKDVHSPYPDSSVSNVSGSPAYGNGSSGSRVSLPLPPYPPNKSTYPPSCKALVSRKGLFDFIRLIDRHRKGDVASWTFCLSTWAPTRKC